MTTILVMDEDQAIRKRYAKELSEEGYEVDAAMPQGSSSS